MQPYRLSKEEINALNILSFQGKSEEVTDPTRLDEICDLLSKESVIGFDTESRPSFKRGQNFPVSVIQLVTNTHAYLVRNLQTTITKKFANFLCNAHIKKLGIALHDDVKKLSKFVPDICGDGFVDLSTIARKKGIIQIGARALTARYLGGKLSKAMQTSNWGAVHLSEKQKRYAATDGWVCLHIYPKLLADTTDYHAMAEALERAKETSETASPQPSENG
jgi:ribonuclease D